VLAISMTEPAVRSIVIALGALERDDGNGKNDELAMRHYSMSMRALHDRIPMEGQDSTQIILVACLLFVAFEFKKTGWAEAKSHLEGGMSIIRETQGNLPAVTSQDTTLKPLAEAFERLDIQMSLFTAQRVHLNRAVMDTIMDRAPGDTEFRSTNEAHRHLNLRMAAMSELVHFADEHRFTPKGMSGKGYEAFENQILQQLIALSQWDVAMPDLLPRLTRPKDLAAAKVLQTHHICCRLMVSTALTNGREELWTVIPRTSNASWRSPASLKPFCPRNAATPPHWTWA